jgi:hypothetical protein
MSRLIDDVVYPWDLLNSKAKYLREQIVERWQRLLDRYGDNEHRIHKFLSDNANMFFVNHRQSHFVISKLRLGSDIIPDMVIANDFWSLGIGYDFIELKKPSDLAFTKEGNASAALSRAIQQSLNYKYWLQTHVVEAQKRLGTCNGRDDFDRIFRFMIFIGRRDEMMKWQRQRKALSEGLNITIRSYDALTDTLRGKLFTMSISDNSTEAINLSPVFANLLANPFCSAFSDTEWKGYLKEKKFWTHIIYNDPETTLKWRRYSNSFKKFKAFLKKQGYDTARGDLILRSSAHAIERFPTQELFCR